MKRLDSNQWADFYSTDKARFIANQIMNNKLSAQTKEMLKIVSANSYKTVCEIGCGSGQTVICLAGRGTHVTAVDYQKESLELVKKVAEIFSEEVKKYYSNSG